MITPAEIIAKAERQYLPFLRAWLCGEQFFPIIIAVGRLPSDYISLNQAVAQLLNGSKEVKGSGYTVIRQTQQTRAFGSQSLPTQIQIESERDLLTLIGKKGEFANFGHDISLIRASLPVLETWLAENPQYVIEQHGDWPALLVVCRYLLENPRPDLYCRELPIAVHTKFIEQHTAILRRLLDAILPEAAIDQSQSQFERRFGLRYDQPLIRLRLLDSTIASTLGLTVTDFAAPVSQIAALTLGKQRCLIVENKLTFLTLPALPNTIAIFGGGFRVELLREIEWLHECSIYYWGDLDAQGFQILATLRSSYPQTTTILMDRQTLEQYRQFVVAGTPCNSSPLPGLSYEEQQLFEYLASNQLRLEQERIEYQYVLRTLRALFGDS